METLKKFGMFFLLFLTIVGALGTIGWLIYSKAWVILAGALVVDGWAAKPYINAVKQFINGSEAE